MCATQGATGHRGWWWDFFHLKWGLVALSRLISRLDNGLSVTLLASRLDQRVTYPTERSENVNVDQRRGPRAPGARVLLIATVPVAALFVLAVNAMSGESHLSDIVIDTTGTPVLQIDSDHVDFGDVPYNQMVEASFEITNAGDATLVFAEKPFIEVKDGC